MLHPLLRGSFTLSLALALAWLALALRSPRGAADAQALLDLQAWDAKGGARPVGLLLAEGGSITVMDAPGANAPEGARLLRARGATVVPGLIDLLVFPTLRGDNPEDSFPIPVGQALGAYARQGVCSVLVSGAKRSVRSQGRLPEGGALWPRLIFSGPLYTAAGGWRPSGMTPWALSSAELSELADLGDAWREHLRFAYPFVLASVEHEGREQLSIPLPVLKRLGELAHMQGWRLGVHVQTVEKALLSLEAQPDLMIGAFYKSEVSEALSAGLRSQRVTYAPCLSPLIAASRAQERAAAGALTDSASVRDAEKYQRWARDRGVDAAAVALAQRNVLRLRDAGVRLGLASGSGLPGVAHESGALDELDALRACGLSAAEALEAATFGGATALGRDDLGRLRPGASADLLLLSGDPLLDWKVLRRPLAVLSQGRLLRFAESDSGAHGTQAP